MSPLRSQVSEQETGNQFMNCAFCFEDIGPLSISEREEHYERHLNGNPTDDFEGSKHSPIVIDSMPQHMIMSHSEKSTHKSPANKGKKPAKSFPCTKETDGFWYSAQPTAPPPSFTPGLIQLLKKGLLKGHDRGLTRRAVLCNENAVHINREPWDANWGCGYRNFLMACASLMNQTQQPLYFPLLDSPLSPSVRNLQRWIEAAWKQGFDKEGQQELKHLADTKKWIGTADLWVAFVFRGIPAELVDFDLGKQSQEKASDLVVEWIVNYFTASSQATSRPTDAFESLKVSPIITTEKIPIILQHDGHSRTVVGYEVDKNGTTSLLVFDPSYRPPAELRNAALEEHCRQNESSVGQSPSLKRKRSETEQMFQKAGTSGQKQFKSSTTLFSSIGNNTISRKAKGLDIYDAIKKFRLDPKKLRQKKQYQILYFPMNAPLTDYERMQRKVVRSTKIS